MKKNIILTMVIALALMLSGCRDTSTIIPDNEEPAITNPEVIEDNPDTSTDDKEPETPVDEEEPVIVDEPDPEPEVVKPVDIDYTEYVVKANKYQPGTYYNYSLKLNAYNGYPFVVVDIDDYGNISGVYIDETCQYATYYTDSENNLYIRVNSSGDIPITFRKIDKGTNAVDFPTIEDSIKNYDLVSGVDVDAINALKPVNISETEYILNNALLVNGISFRDQSDAISKKIINDNTTAGINLIFDGKNYTTDSIEDVNMSVGVYLDLINEILLNDAKYQTGTKLLDDSSAIYGVYETGIYFANSEKYYDSTSIKTGYVYDFSLVFVDDYGHISGVYTDSTVSDNIVSGAVLTKNLLEDNYGMSATTGNLEYYEQVKLLNDAVEKNQNIQFIDLDNETNNQTTDTISGLSIDISYLVDEIDASLKTAAFTNYNDGLYAVKNDDVYIYVTIDDNSVKYINVYDSNLSDKKNLELNAEINEISVNNFNINYDADGKIINYDFDLLDKTYIEKALFAIRNLDEDNYLSDEFGYNFINYLGDGAYFDSLEDDNGNNQYMFINVEDNRVISCVYDVEKDGETVLSSNDKDDYIELADAFINNQAYLVDYVLSKYDYSNDNTLLSPKNIEVFNGFDDIDVESFSELLKNVLRDSCDSKIDFDNEIIYSSLEEQISKVVLISGFKTIPLSLPQSSTPISDVDGYYTIEYDINNKDVDINRDKNSSFYKITLDDDIDKSFTTNLTVTINRIVGKNETKISEKEIPLNIYDFVSGCTVLFNSYDLTTTQIVSGARLDLPFTSDIEDTITYKDIKYISSNSYVLPNDGYVVSSSQIINQDLDNTQEFKIKAYVDLNDNGILDVGEVANVYYIEAYTKADALTYAIENAELGNIYKRIEDDFIADCTSQIVGVSYLYRVDASSSLSVGEVLDDNTQKFTVIRQQKRTVPKVYAEINGCGDPYKVYFDVEVEATNVEMNMLYAKRTVENYNIDEVSKNYAALYTDFDFDGFLADLVYFDEPGESVQISSSDFGTYINQTTGKFSKTTDLVEDPFDITITLKATYPTKYASNLQSYSKKLDITVFPRDDIKTLINNELSEFDNINIDISQNASKNVVIDLPTTGVSGISSVTYAAENADESVYLLDGNRLVIFTESGTFSDNYSSKFTIKVTDTYADYSNSKVISLVVKE